MGNSSMPEPHCWTEGDLTLAWQTGRDYLAPGALEALDDFLHAPPAPRLSREERYARDMAEMEAHAARFHAKHGTKPRVVAA